MFSKTPSYFYNFDSDFPPILLTENNEDCPPGELYKLQENRGTPRSSG